MHRNAQGSQWGDRVQAQPVAGIVGVTNDGIVKARNRDILRDTYATFTQIRHRTDRHFVIDADHGGHFWKISEHLSSVFVAGGQFELGAF